MRSNAVSLNADPNAVTAGLPVPTFTPRFKEPLHVGRPNTGDADEFLARAKEIFDRRWFTNNGPFVQEFEERLKAHLGVRHCIPICNATIALGIAAAALGLEGEVIVPAFTFIASAHSLLWQKITPVFCDIDPRTHNIDPVKAEALITSRTSAILGVHVWGRPCAIDELSLLCRRSGLKLLFDAAHAFGCSYKEKMIGNFGDAEVFSFHATKFFHTFEGGAIATNNDELAAKVRLLKNFGFAGIDSVVALGTNGKMTEISAAMGLTSLDSLQEIVGRNYVNYACYRECFTNIPGLAVYLHDEGERNNYQYVIAEVTEHEAGFTRDELVDFLHRHNVLVRRYFYPGCHRMEPYLSMSPPRQNLPETEALSSRILAFPSGTAVGTEEIRAIAELIHEFQRQRRLR